MENKKPLVNGIAKGIFFLVTCYLLFMLGNVVMKKNIKDHQASGPEVFFYVCAFQWPISMAVPFFAKQDVLNIQQEFRGILVRRVLTNGMASSLLYVAFQFSGFTKSVCIFQMYSFFIPFFGFFMVGTKVRPWDIIGILSAITGMIMVVQPFKQTESASNELWKDLLGCFIAFLASLTLAISIVYIQVLARGGIHFSISVFYFSLGGIITSPIVSFFMPRHRFPDYDFSFFFMALVSAVFFFGGNMFFMIAQKNVTGPTIGLVAYITIVFSLVFDIVFFHHQPNALELLGITLILAVNIVIGVLKIKGVLI